MEKGDLSGKSEHRACMHDHTWLRLAKSPTSNAATAQPTATPTLWCGNKKMRDRYRARALWRRWCVRRRGRHGADGARGLGFDDCCKCLQIPSSPTPRGAQSRCKPRHKGQRSAWFSGRWVQVGDVLHGQEWSRMVFPDDEADEGWTISVLGRHFSLRLDRPGAPAGWDYLGIVGQAAGCLGCWEDFRWDGSLV